MPFNVTKVQAAVQQMSRTHKTVVKKPPRTGKKAKVSDSPDGAEARRIKSTNFVSRSELFRRIKLLEKRLRSISSTAQEAEYKELVDKITEYKSIRSVHATLPNRKVKPSKTKRNRKGAAMMYRSPRHHQRKVYISPEVRASNKSKDGKPTVNLRAPAKSTLSVVGSTKPWINPVRKNVRKSIRTRKEFFKLRSRFYRDIHGHKYPPYNRGTKELVSVQAA